MAKWEHVRLMKLREKVSSKLNHCFWVFFIRILSKEKCFLRLINISCSTLFKIHRQHRHLRSPQTSPVTGLGQSVRTLWFVCGTWPLTFWSNPRLSIRNHAVLWTGPHLLVKCFHPAASRKATIKTTRHPTCQIRTP